MKKVIFWAVLVVFLSTCKSPPQPTPTPATPQERIYVDRERIVEVVSPPDTLMPLTGSILQRLLSRLSGDINEELGKYQFILFGRVVLERTGLQLNDSLRERGTARFENIHERVSITINDRTEGQAQAIERRGNQVVLFLSFEEDEVIEADGEKEVTKLQLMFSAPVATPDAYFNLVYDSSSARGDEKGGLTYGKNEYRLKYTGDTPYILIRLSQEDIDRPTSRTVTGRRVAD